MEELNLFELGLEEIKKKEYECGYAEEQEPCEDCISRDHLLSVANMDGAYGYVSTHDIAKAPPVNPKQNDVNDVLDKIREETKSKKFGLTDTEDGRRIQSDIHAAFDGGIECALQIIDKYKAESED